jgi:hypothetical protein
MLLSNEDIIHASVRGRGYLSELKGVIDEITQAKAIPKIPLD